VLWTVTGLGSQAQPWPLDLIGRGR